MTESTVSTRSFGDLCFFYVANAVHDAIVLKMGIPRPRVEVFTLNRTVWRPLCYDARYQFAREHFNG